MKLSAINRNTLLASKDFTKRVSQTFNDFEYIVIDGAITDCCIEVDKRNGFSLCPSEMCLKTYSGI